MPLEFPKKIVNQQRIEDLLSQYNKIEMKMTRDEHGKVTQVLFRMYDDTEFAIIYADGKDLAETLADAEHQTDLFHQLLSYEPNS